MFARLNWDTRYNIYKRFSSFQKLYTYIEKMNHLIIKHVQTVQMVFKLYISTYERVANFQK